MDPVNLSVTLGLASAIPGRESARASTSDDAAKLRIVNSS
jgi:hypothetical protein